MMMTMETEKKMRKKCSTCRWHDPFSWVCCNGDSPFRAFITDKDKSSCEAWEMLVIEGEEWKDIPGYEGLYAVSNAGRIKREDRILQPYFTEKGYYRIGLTMYGRKKQYRVHRLVAEAFIPNPNNYHNVHHRDGNKKNNAVSNLEWVAGSMD